MTLLTSLLTATATQAAPACPTAPDAADWQNFSQRFVSADGRVIDTGNGNVSHSEGQGYGLLFAQAHDARADFDRIWGWTRQTLQTRPNDKLLAWRWEPAKAGIGGKISDTNNATDGDLLVAWGLLRAASRWQNTAYAEAAGAILADVKRLTIVPGDGGGHWLLPGSAGFVSKDRVTVVNPSYFLFPAFQAFAASDKDPVWASLSQSSLRVLARARFGRWGLPPDWLALAEGRPPQPAKDMPSKGAPIEFGWNAVRVPLNLIWAGYSDPWYLQPYTSFWTQARPDGQPAPTVRLADGAIPSYAGPVGLKVLADYAVALVTGQGSPNWPSVAKTEDYYSAALLLMTKMACWDTRP